MGEIGPRAQAAIPNLKDLIQTNDHIATAALIALGRIEPQKQEWIDTMIERLDSEPYWLTLELGRRGKRSRAALPKIRLIADTNPLDTTRAMAAVAAWQIDPQGPAPLEVITDYVAKENRGSYDLVRLLGELGPDARPALPTLLKLRHGRGMMMRDYAIDALRKIAPEYASNPWHK